jgi:hypothetical protein
MESGIKQICFLIVRVELEGKNNSSNGYVLDNRRVMCDTNFYIAGSKIAARFLGVMGISFFREKWFVPF